jgi:hypothetical protein
MKRTWITRLLAIMPLALGLIVAAAGCQEGPAEDTGERVDAAAREARDTVNPPDNPAEAAGRAIEDATTQGPAERAGEAADRAVDEATDPTKP